MILKNIKNIIIPALLILTMTLFAGGMAEAAEASVKLELPVRQIIEVRDGTVGSVPTTGTYELSVLSEDAPMPEGSKDKAYSFTIEGRDNSVTLSFIYTHGGIFQYRLIQTTQGAGNYACDGTEYQISVYVKNADDGGLVTEVIAEKESGKKSGEICFINRYEGPQAVVTPDADTKPVKTGDDGEVFLQIFFAGSAATVLFAAVCFGRRRRAAEP